EQADWLEDMDEEIDEQMKRIKPGMFRIASTTTQTRTPQLPHASRNTNPYMSKSSGVIHTTSVSRPQLKCFRSLYDGASVFN
ncbi:hypothetical protein Tco_0333904, partial [Tanacetum coccineum]